ncbi:MAG: TRAP transporter substrate-binding protein DctP [Leptospiraceae bacterium]|nr:TRAP transporter substrate-binding protein DctP [Leptospiraceae bacterium]
MKNILTIITMLFLGSVSVFSVTIKYATIAPQGSVWAENAEKMKKEIEQKSKGSLKVQIFYGGVAGEETTVLKKLKAGMIDMASFTGIALGNEVSEVRLLELPMFFNNEKQVDAVVKALYPDFEKKFQQRGFVLAGWGESGFVYLMSQKPIQRIEDMKGTKIWAPKGDPLVKSMLAEFGLIPVFLGFESVLPQLQTGGIEAVYAPPMGAIGLQWFRYVKHYSNIQLAHGTGATLISSKTYKKLNAEQQKILKETSEKYSRELVKTLRSENEKGMAILKKRGIKAVEVNNADAQTLREKSVLVQNKLVGSLYSKDLLNKARAARDSAR